MIWYFWTSRTRPQAQGPNIMDIMDTGPPIQATGPPRSGAGVGVGMLRGIQKIEKKGNLVTEININ